MKKRWEIKELPPVEDATRLSESLNNIPLPLATLLLQRGIEDFETARTFFRPDFSETHDPMLMTDMDKAIERLHQAIIGQEKILVYGDYDVDGTTAVALVYKLLRPITPNIDYYIPDRYAEGYGISTQGIDFAAKNDFSLIIALDCGVKANDKIDYANEKNIDFIICDHHRPGDQLPNAIAVLDPKREDCSYPFDELCGCGVGYKLMEAYYQQHDHDQSALKDQLDLLATSIAADIVPMVGENRVLAHYGLKKINTNPGPGIAAIMELSKLKKEFTITDVVFKIAPRINAAGRIASGRKAVELLVADHKNTAADQSQLIDENNSQRKALDASITEEALDMLNSIEGYAGRKTTVVYKEDWHKGVIGIVASRLIENHYRPTVVLTRSNGVAAGSVRSVHGFDVYEAISACSDTLIQFGGHKYAAGLTLELDRIEDFKTRFEEVVSATIQEDQLVPVQHVDLHLDLSEVNSRFYRILKQFSPFGPGNMKPVFYTEEVLTTDRMRIVGNNHLKFQVFQPDAPGQIMEAIGFGLGEYYSHLVEGTPFRICYNIEENVWNGRVDLQLNVKDIQLD